MTIKQSNEQTLGEAIKELIAAYRIGPKLNEAKMIGSWEKIVGSMIAKHTVSLNVNKRILYVELDSAALRNELTYAREKIRKMLNKEAGEELIDKVIFK
jgi:predicted nucleic acid-binding Zn ribbon protein